MQLFKRLKKHQQFQFQFLEQITINFEYMRTGPSLILNDLLYSQYKTYFLFKMTILHATAKYKLSSTIIASDIGAADIGIWYKSRAVGALLNAS